MQTMAGGRFSVQPGILHLLQTLIKDLRVLFKKKKSIVSDVED